MFSKPWWTVVGSTLALVVSQGPIVLFTFGVFVKPITAETHWNRSTVSMGVAFALILGGIATPIVGRLIDRWGIHPVTLSFIAAFAASVAAISLTRASPILRSWCSMPLRA
jgi:predicted MFS family arabinose efflux permease